MDNPFYITKASEYSDAQINELWVNFGGKGMPNPRDYTPKYILGGKGCGKTHFLRYYSYPLQKLRHGNIKEVISKDKYIGIYSVLSTIDASRFEAKGISKDQWKAVFGYYFELYISSFLLKTIKEFINSEDGKKKEQEFVQNVIELFLDDIELDSINFDSLLKYVEGRRKNIDYEIENVAFIGNFKNININLKSGELIFGIPIALRKTYNEFHDVLFIYIMDEYEKLLDWQKVYVNSLVWEKVHPSTFWIGARKYGYTNMTTMTGEELKKGSEYIPFFMDNFYQNNDKEYSTFARKLIDKRIQSTKIGTINDLKSKFENGKGNAIEMIVEKKKGDYKHLRTLKKELTSAIKKGYCTDSEENISQIIGLIKSDTEDNPLEQKYKLYLFYQIWAEHKETKLKNIAELVDKEYHQYKFGADTKFRNIIEKYKTDFIAQLCEENGVEYYAYSGLDDFISLSWGNPRILLLLLKNTFEISQVFQERPMDDDGHISIRSQYMGIKETSKWYLEDAELSGEIGNDIDVAIQNLAKYLRLYRFSEKPTETSVCAFNFGSEDVSPEAIHLIKMMELHSLLIEVDKGRKQRNTGKVEFTYQLNRILAPNWNLPSSRRGIADLDGKVVESIFHNSRFKNFNTEYTLLKNRMNAPFNKKNSDMNTFF